MVRDPVVDAAARALYLGIGLVVRRLRHVKAQGGELTLPEASALARLDREGPATMAALARREQISPQSMGATLAALETRGLIARGNDAADGRRVVLAPTDAGMRVLRDGRNERMELIADALARFTPAEIAQVATVAPLLERLAAQL